MAFAALCYIGVTLLLFRNVLPVLTTNLPSDLGDPLLNTSILAWNAKHLPLTTDWWNFPAFAPLSGVTAFTEHLLGAYPLSSPIIWETGNAVLAYNVLLLACFPLNGLATYALVLVNGYSGYIPPHHTALREALVRHLPQVFDPFRERADLYVIVRPEVEQDFVEWLETLHGIGHLPDTGAWRLYRLPREGSGPLPPPVMPLPKPGAAVLRVVGQ